MSRSTQAARLSQELSETTGVAVEVRYESGATWSIQWSNGPTVDQMRDIVPGALASAPAMADRTLSYFRSWTQQAWAARAIAARRDGRLARAIAATVDAHRAALRGQSWAQSDDALSAEDHATLGYIEDLLDQTANPDRLDDPADGPLVAELLAAGRRRAAHGVSDSPPSEWRMVRVLTNDARAPKPNPAGPTLHVLPGCA